MQTHPPLWKVGLVVAVLCASGCVTARSKPATEPFRQEVRFDEIVITGDLELEKLNDEELFAKGEAAFAAEDWGQAARFFGRLADFHPHSRHRRAALYNAGLALEKTKSWEDAYMRFQELSDPAHGQNDAVDAAFRVAETLYHLERFEAAIQVLTVLGDRTDLSVNKRFEAQVQRGVCELEAGLPDVAETTLRKTVALWQELKDPDDVDDYFPAQAQFFLGEIFRTHYEAVQLDGAKSADELARDLEYKSELLLSAQGHYLRAIRIGNGYWATAAGSQIGFLYENLYDHMIHSPAPRELSESESDVYRQELRKKIRILLTKAINIYERTLEAAERIGAQSPFVEKTRVSLQKMKELLVADAESEESVTGEQRPAGGGMPSTGRPIKRAPPQRDRSASEPHS